MGLFTPTPPIPKEPRAVDRGVADRCDACHRPDTNRAGEVRENLALSLCTDVKSCRAASRAVNV